MEKVSSTIFIAMFLFTLLGCNGQLLDELDESADENFCPGIRLADGTCPFSDGQFNIKSWNFNNSNNYTYVSNYVELSSGSANLKSVDQLHSGLDFNVGTHVGTYYDSVNQILSLVNKTNSSLHVNSIFPGKKNNLIGYWPMDNSDADKSGNNLSVTSRAGTNFDSNSKVGSYAYKKINNLAGSLVTNLPDTTTALTVSMWLLQDSFNSWRRVLTKGLDDSTIDWRLMSDNVDSYRIELIGDTGWCGTGNLLKLETGVWQHVAFTFDGSKVRLYLNAKLVQESNCNRILRNSGANLAFGQITGSSGLDGSMDEFAVWNIAFSDSEITMLYQAQAQHYSELSSSWTPEYSNIVGYWKMDGTWQDSSINGNHGIQQADTTFSPSNKVGSLSATFDGVGDHIQVSNSSDFDFSNDNFSVAGWFKANSTATARVGLFGHGSPGYINLFLRESTHGSAHKLVFETKDSDLTYKGVTSSSQMRDDLWHHFTAVRDGSNNLLSLYIDGKLDQQILDIRTGNFNFAGTIYLGRDNSGLNFDGELDDMAVWEISLSQLDVAEIYNRQKQKYAGHYDSPILDLGISGSWTDLRAITTLPFMKELSSTGESSTDYSSLGGNLSDGLKGYWDMNEASGTTINDRSGEVPKNDGILNSGTVNAPGFLGGAVSLSGWGQWIETSNMNLGNTFTFSMWAKITSNSTTTNYLFSNKTGGAASDGFTFSINNWNSDDRIIQFNTGNGGGYSSAESPAGTAPVSDGKWHHYLVSVNKTSGKALIFIDALQVNTADVAIRTDFSTTGVMYIGANADKAAAINGSIDDVSLWNRELSSFEIQQLYRRGANRLKYQVRSCDDSVCDTETFQGPDGTGTTYFSELQNNTTIDGSGNPIGAVKTTSPDYIFSDFVSAPSNNRYFQYRVYMESDDENDLCSGLPCMPELTSVELGPSGRYFGGTPTVVTNSPISYDKINSITISESGTCSIGYQLSKDGTNYYFWNGLTWAAVSGDLDRNPKTVVSTNIKKYSNQFGAGNLYVKAYLTSDTSQSCILSDIRIENVK